jgi:hypothetical protein
VQVQECDTNYMLSRFLSLPLGLRLQPELHVNTKGDVMLWEISHISFSGMNIIFPGTKYTLVRNNHVADADLIVHGGA